MKQERMITAPDGATIATQSFGEPSSPAILLSMGATASMLWWPEAFCEGLAARGHHVIRYDHRDTGRSTTGAPGRAAYTVADLRDDIIAILDGYGTEQAHLVGMSLGGYLAQLVAIDRPNRVLSLTLIASEPVGGVETPLPGMSDDMIAAFSALPDLDWMSGSAVEAVLMELARLCTGPGRTFDEAATRRRVKGEMGRGINIHSAFNHAAMEAGALGSPRVQDITQPVLVIHGSHDPVLPVENGRAIAAHAQRAELLELDGAGHELNAADLEPILLRMRDFLRRAVNI